jgi:hypothetical protein
MPACGEVVEKLGGRNLQPAGENRPPREPDPEAAEEPAPQAAPEPAAPAAMPSAPSATQRGAVFRPVLDAYLSLTADLSADNEAAAIEHAAAFVEAVSDAAADAAAGEGAAWQTDLEALAELSSGLTQATDIAGLRTGLAPLAPKLAPMVRRSGLSERPLYRIHCPMAFDMTGADWLQTDEDVRNPYFGTRMLTCGLVVEIVGGPDAASAGGQEHE